MEQNNWIIRSLKRLNALRRGLLNQFWLAETRARGVELGCDIIFNGRPYIARAAGSRIALGERVVLNSSLRSNPIGCSRPVTLCTLRPDAELILDRFVGISGSALCAAVSIRVGEGTFVGPEAMLLDNDFHSPMGEWRWGDATQDNPRPIVVGRGVFIGACALILKGVTIGDRAVVGAGAVVTCDVPAWHLAVGNPVRILPQRTPPPPR